MDVASVVDYYGLLASVFALVVSVALCVELGSRPRRSKKSGASKLASPNSEAEPGAGNESAALNQPAHASGEPGLEKTLIPNQPFGQGQAPAPALKGAGGAGSTSGDPASNSSSNSAVDFNSALNQVESIADLQLTFVDGLLGSRRKYDVALAILNEYKAASVPISDAGLTMATEAYLSATRSGTFKNPHKKPTGDFNKVERRPTEETAKPRKKKTASGGD